MMRCTPPSLPIVARRAIGVAMLLVLVGGARPAAGQFNPFVGPRQTVTDEQVQQAIADITEALLRSQGADGSWGNDLGTTALVTYALLTAGQSNQSEPLAKAIDLLDGSPRNRGTGRSRINAAARNRDLSGTYASSLRNHIWATLPPAYEANLKAETRLLVNGIGGGPAGGGYTYLPLLNLSMGSGGGAFDNSNTQYGVLGVWEGAKRGVPVPKNYWQAVEDHFLTLQDQDGGWAYTQRGTSYGSMTCAGLACLFIVRDQLHIEDFRIPAAYAGSHLLHSIESGLSWLDENFSATANMTADAGRNMPRGIGAFIGGRFYHYYMVSVERVALASGYKYFGGRNWYAEGAAALLDNPGRDVRDLAFTLIFLSRGRVPIFLNKLRLQNHHWNNRPHDAAAITDWVSGEIERRMNWQVAEIQREPEDWLDAPLLYLTGHEALRLTEREEAKIKRYIDLGGLLITAGEGTGMEFSESVIEMLGRLYPEYPLARLEDSDPLCKLMFPITNDRLSAFSVHNGVRHLAIHLPNDVPWTLHSSDHSEETVWQFFVNTYLYATEKAHGKPRLAEHYAARRRGRVGESLHVARLQYVGNWDPEPAAWEIQANRMHNDAAGEIRIEYLPIEELAHSNVPLAHLAGTKPITLSESQRQAVRQYVQRGGRLLIESIGGTGGFAADIERQLVEAGIPDGKRPALYEGHPPWETDADGPAFSSADFRYYMKLQDEGNLNTLRIRTHAVGGRPNIILSDDDLSYAMLDHPVWGVRGYNSAAAYRLMKGLVRWANAR